MRQMKSYISLALALLFLILSCPIFAVATSVPVSPNGTWQTMNPERQAALKTKITLKPC